MTRGSCFATASRMKTNLYIFKCPIDSLRLYLEMNILTLYCYYYYHYYYYYTKNKIVLVRMTLSRIRCTGT